MGGCVSKDDAKKKDGKDDKFADISAEGNNTGGPAATVNTSKQSASYHPGPELPGRQRSVQTPGEHSRLVISAVWFGQVLTNTIDSKKKRSLKNVLPQSGVVMFEQS